MSDDLKRARGDDDRRRFALVLNWFLLLALVVLIMVGARASETPTPARLRSVGIVAGAVMALALSRYLLARGNLTFGVTTVYLMLFSVTIATPVSAPPSSSNDFSFSFALPLIAIMLVLPYVGERALRRLLGAAWLITLAAMLISIVKNSAPLEPQGPITLAMLAALLYFLLWQFRQQIEGTLRQEQLNSRALEAARDELQARVGELQEVRAQLQAQLGQAQQSNQELERLRGELERRVLAEQAAQAQARQLQELEAQNSRRLEQAVAGYQEFAARVATGDLTLRVSVEHEGALGQLGVSLNAMVESLQQLTRQVHQASMGIAGTAAEILAATTQQASGAAQQSAAIAQTSTTIDEVNAIALRTAEQARQVVRDNQQMVEVARQGLRAVDETMGGMRGIRAQVEGIAETILALSEQNQAIGAIIDTVSELADQSNLLALNAAIEAARAGEQGKSFAVVAQHVRELAERSKEAGAQVRQIVGEIQQASNTAVMVTEEGTKGAEAGARLASQAGEIIQRITGEVESSAQSNMQMEAAAQQQMVGMAQIDQAIQAIQQATSQALSSTRQTEQAARDLNTLAQSLQRTIATYRV